MGAATNAAESADAETAYRAHLTARANEAADALAKGQAALGANDLSGAIAWLERARRVSGGNDAVDLLLATAYLRAGNRAAAALFQTLAQRHDLLEAWLGLAAARSQENASDSAIAALHQALCGHAGPMPQGFRALAEGRPWCCLNGNRVEVHGATAPFHLRFNGRRVPTPPARLNPGPALLAIAGLSEAPLGSPLDLRRIHRLDAFVEATATALQGFAWYPNAPETVPQLRLIAGRQQHSIVLGPPASLATASEPHDHPLPRRRPFRIPLSDLPAVRTIRIVGPTGQDIPGSPIDPFLLQRAGAAIAAAAAGHPATAESLAGAALPVGLRCAAPAIAPSAAPPAVVVPVHGGGAVVQACLASLLETTVTPPIVVDDAFPDPALAAFLDRLAQQNRIVLLRLPRNSGFPAAANHGIRAAGRADVVLLNSDTLLPPYWLEKLREAAHATPDTGTATPLSNDATILSYPNAEAPNPVPDLAEVRRLDRLAARANAGRTAAIPTGIGFCLYLRRDCLDQTGLLREDVFAQGYGEENDFCLRASAFGWRHVAALDVFVGHVGGTSFGATRRPLLTRNLALLNRLHPGYDALIAAGDHAPALAHARRRLDLARLGKPTAPAILLVTHDLGGGVERFVVARATALRAQGTPPVILRPVLQRPLRAGTGQCRIDVGPDLPNLVFDAETEFPALLRCLARFRPQRVEFHHLLGHHPAILSLPERLGIAQETYLHDYAWFCPRITLVAAGRYCGEPPPTACDACIQDHGRNTDEDISVAALRTRSAAVLAAGRVIAPSADVAARFARQLPPLAPAVVQWDASRPALLRPVPPASPAAPRIAAVLGAIGIEKGFDVLLACARDAADRDLPLRFAVIGHTTADARLLATGRVFITGEYTPDEVPALTATHGVQIVFLPSIWPETWCFTLSEAWDAGFSVVAFDIGSQAHRIRALGGGALLPLGAPAAAINRALLAPQLLPAR